MGLLQTLSQSDKTSADNTGFSDKLGSSRRILVVDDNEASALTLSWALELSGFDVKASFDGPTALTIAAQFHPDIVLLDIGMPHMDGYEVCRRLRQLPSLDGIYIIAQTGWGDAEVRQMTHAAGFDDHLTKPLDLMAIIEKLKGRIAN